MLVRCWAVLKFSGRTPKLKAASVTSWTCSSQQQRRRHQFHAGAPLAVLGFSGLIDSKQPMGRPGPASLSICSVGTGLMLVRR